MVGLAGGEHGALPQNYYLLFETKYVCRIKFVCDVFCRNWNNLSVYSPLKGEILKSYLSSIIRGFNYIKIELMKT